MSKRRGDKHMAKKQRYNESDDDDEEEDESFHSGDDDEDEEGEEEDEESEWEEIPAEAMQPVQRRYFTKDRTLQQQPGAEEEEDEGEEGNGEGDYDDNDDDLDDDDEEDWITVRLDYSAAPMSQQNEVLHNFTDFWQKLLASPEYANASEQDRIGLIISDHYCLGDIQDLTDKFNDAQVLAALKSRLVSLVFVSTSLWAADGDVSIRFAQALSQYPKLTHITFDMSSLYSSLEICATGEHDTEADGKLSAALITHISSLQSLSVEGADDQQMERMCDALLYKEPGQGSALKSLRIDSASFGPYGFECLNNVLSTNSVLESLLLPCHTKISNDSVITLAPALSSNKTLSLLDLHVSELGHEGVTELGIEVLCQSMESNPACVLSRIDLSGDDGAPEISAELQKRLNKCLVRNSKRNNDKYLKYAKMPVWKRHTYDD